MKWLTWLTILAVFVLGAVTGAPLGMKIERDRFLKMQNQGPATLMDKALNVIRVEVKLDSPQVEKLREVLERAQPMLAEVENERRRKTIGVMESVRSSVFAFLTEDQKQRYNSLHEGWRKNLGPAATAAAAAAAAFLGK
jgi:hypothetical protein